MIAEVACHIPVYKLFDYLVPKDLEGDPSSLVGRRVSISFGYKKTVGVVSKIKETSDAPLGKLKPLTGFIDETPVLSQQQIELGEWLSRRYMSSLGEALFALLPPGKDRLKSFKASKEIEPVIEIDVVPLETAPVPTPEQKEAVQKIQKSFEAGKAPVFLLRGVAAAGKTEVYMAAIQEALTRNKSALVLVPEIGLAEQMAAMLINRFGPKVFLMHSNMSPKERYEGWWKVKKGEVPIVIGARSTILAPLENIGVIVVDEEQESSYKEDRKPRFHVRDVAIERGRMAKAPVVFGSATPSLELYEKTLSGEAILLELSGRAIPSARPNITLVDLKKVKARGLISDPLVEEMASRFKIREQTILFLNRRGFFRYIRCPHCAWVLRCPTCEIALVRHKTDGYLCHYCAHKEAAPAKCPKCGEKKLFAGGFGTQRIEEEVQKQFPWVHVARWDRDSVSKPGQQKKIFEEFKEGKYDVLIGTQIVAQGFNFPKVTLVGVLDADSQLHIPDFRSAERTFQLVSQVAGRSGRADVTGAVVIQTRHPDHYAISSVLTMDYAGFAQKELKFREELNYPPYRRLIHITAEGKKAEVEIQRLSDWVDTLQHEESIAVLGPTEGKILLKVPRSVFDLFLAEFRAYLSVKTNHLIINVDPESFN